MASPPTELRASDGLAYRVLGTIGSGGQGITLRIAERKSGRPAVAKVFHPEYDKDTTRRRIAWLVGARLPERSPGLSGPVAELRREHGVGYVMPLVEGQSLEDEMARPHWTLLEALGMGAALCHAVAALERMEIAHGDLSASNAFVLRDRHGVFQTTLIDLDNFAHRDVPKPPMIGAKSYWSPELLEGACPSIGSDRFSLAVLIHELLLLRHPFSGVLPQDADESLYDSALRAARWYDDPTSTSHGAGSSSGYPSTILDADVKRLFRRSITGVVADRPSALAWAETLTGALDRVWECNGCKVQCLNDSARRSCPNCARVPTPLVLETTTGRRIVLLKPVTILGREDLGGDGTISSRHAIIRRHGLECRIQDASTNGTSILGPTGWARIEEGHETSMGPGNRIRFARSVEALVRE